MRYGYPMPPPTVFFLALQAVAKDWVAFGPTKTGAVYRFKGKLPQAHE